MALFLHCLAMESSSGGHPGTHSVYCFFQYSGTFCDSEVAIVPWVVHQTGNWVKTIGALLSRVAYNRLQKENEGRTPVFICWLGIVKD